MTTSRHRRRFDTQRGFTLLEVLMAMAVLGTAVLALAGLQARNVDISREIRDVTVAGTLASQVVTLIKISPFPEIGTVSGEFTDSRDDSAGSFDEDPLPYGGTEANEYLWQREVTETALENLRQVRVAVTRRDSDRVLAQLWFAVRK